MYPYVFGIPAWGLLAALGVVCVYVLLGRAAARDGHHPDLAVDVTLIVIVAGLIGSRLLHLWEYRAVYRALPWQAMVRLDRGGMSWYGAFATVLPSAWWYARRKGIAALALLDLGALFLAAAQGFGRLGCFMAGCCWGTVAGPGSVWAPIAVRFPTGSPAWCAHAAQWLGVEPTRFEAIEAAYGRLPAPLRTGSYPVVPVQLLMAAAGFVVLALCWRALGRPRRRHGEVFAMTFTLLALARFGFEFLRADNPMVGALTQHQWISLGAAVFGALLWLFVRRRAPGAAPLSPWGE